jgi:hypothetical protein
MMGDCTDILPAPGEEIKPQQSNCRESHLSGNLL